MKSLAQTKKEMDENDPPIEPMSVWVGRGTNHAVFRRIRILTLDPRPNDHNERRWIYELMHPDGRVIVDAGMLGTTPEFNLRHVFEIETNREDN